jgi:ribose transport system ATP-binding protein
MTTQPTLAINRVSKRFGDVFALEDVSMTVMPGQIHGLIGANGSGKSTLVKIMSGAESATVGSIDFEGETLMTMGTPGEALARGVRVIHQEAPLVDTLTVLESVAVFRGYGSRALAPVRWRSLRRETQELLDRMNVRVSVNMLCSQVSAADRAGLALAVAVGTGDADGSRAGGPAKLVIVDEVTAPIPEAETRAHLDRLRLLADQGVAVVMVTHRMTELEVADDLTILRDGRVAFHQGEGSRPPVGDLVAEMVSDGSGAPLRTSARGSTRRPVEDLWGAVPELARAARTDAPEEGEEAIRIDDLVGAVLDGFSFSARRGEVVGFVGLPSGGIGELPQILAGAQRRRSGTIVVGGRELPIKAEPADIIGAGLAVVPSDRIHAGGVSSLSVSENVVLPDLGRYWHKGKRRRAVVEAVIRALDVRPQNGSALFGSLSGGNQQKVLLGKWLSLRPAVLVLDDPTYGVDPAAREIIFDAILDAARNGMCVLFFSTEPEQVVRVCDRVIVIRDGIAESELAGEELKLEALTEWSYR